MIDLLKAELEQIKAQKMQILANPMMAQYNALLGAEIVLNKLIKQAEKGEAECQSKQP